MNTIEGELSSVDGRAVLRAGALTIGLPEALMGTTKQANNAKVVLGVRPEHLRMGADGLIPATVRVVEALGHERHIIFRLDDGQMIIVRQPSDEAPPKEGETLHLTADPDHLHLFDAETGDRIDA
jgi:ABC-type sugar transport system ATPase subunit